MNTKSKGHKTYNNSLGKKSPGILIYAAILSLGLTLAGCDGTVSSSTPVGTVIAYGGELYQADGQPDSVKTKRITETGWLICNGDAVKRSDYTELYQVVGDSWGEGDKSTTFNLPDLRGVFLRGVNRGRADAYKDTGIEQRERLKPGGSTGDAVGSFQHDQVVAHEHHINELTGQFEVSGDGHSSIVAPVRGINGVQPAPWPGITHTGAATVADDDTTHPKRVGAETRPMNASVYYLIRAK